MQKDLHLPEGAYLVYDFWADHFLGTCRTALPLQLQPCATKVLAVRRRLDRPQILSTSRHVTQGAVDLEQLVWDNDLQVLTAVSRVVRDDPYSVTLHVPADRRPFCESNATSAPEISQVTDEVWRFTIKPLETGLITWSVAFI